MTSGEKRKHRSRDAAHICGRDIRQGHRFKSPNHTVNIKYDSRDTVLVSITCCTVYVKAQFSEYFSL
jgi:hypothetical protein